MSSRGSRKVGLRRWVLRAIAGVFLLGSVLFASALWLQGKAIPAPRWLAGEIETRVNNAIGPDAPFYVGLGGIAVAVDEKGVPRLFLRDVVVSDSEGTPMAQADALRARLAPEALVSGQLAFRRILLSGATLSMVRDRAGNLNLSFGDRGAARGHLGDLVDAVDRAFTFPALEGLEQVEVENLTIAFEDLRTGRVTEATGGRLTVTQAPDQITSRISVRLGPEGESGETVLSIISDMASSNATLATELSNVQAADLAAQSPIFAALAVLDAPISGAFRATIGETARISRIDGALRVGAGVLRPTETVRPVPFDSARAYLRYDATERRVDFDELVVEAEQMQLKGGGYSYVQGPDDEWPDTVLGQIQLSELKVAPKNILAEPAMFDAGAIDFRLRLRPFHLEVGQYYLSRAGLPLRGKGHLTASDEGWAAAVDLEMEEIAIDRLIALWPEPLAPKTRDWLSRKLTGGRILNLSGAFRGTGDERPLAHASFDFEGMALKFMNSLPPVTEATGRASLTGRNFAVSLDAGTITAPEGGRVDLTGSSFRIPNMGESPARAEVMLRTEGAIPAALGILDLPPFELMKKAGRRPDLVAGQVVAETEMAFELGKRLTNDAVDWRVDGRLTDVTSTEILTERELAAERLALRADRDRVEIGGPATIDGLPVDATWVRFNAPGGPPARVEGTVELSPRFLEVFDIPLPPTTLSGAGSGVIELTLPADAPPEFRLRSDLAQLGLQVAAIGWSKPARQPGRFLAEGYLGPSPEVNRIEIEAPGLLARGRVTTRADGRFDRASFSRLRVGDWLDAPVTLVGRGQAAPEVRIGRGALDLRTAAFGGGAGGSGGGGPISLNLDRLVVTEGIQLTDLRGDLTPEGGLSGRITAAVNGGAGISATLVPSQRGTAFRILSEDAGAVLRSAGVFRGARGGSLDMILMPLGTRGHYDGQLQISNLRVRDAPTLAELLSAISVVGLLEQLGGSGMVFSDVDARFRIRPEGIELTQGSAVGPSMGISMEGIYDTVQGRLDMAGVVSPIYLLNAVGSIFSRNREGLFGFNYRMRGPIDDANVSVNPLSILTPGMFREIFRRAPPKIGQ